MKIRDASPMDSKEINNIRQMSGVMENILSYPSEPQDKVEKRIKNRTENDYWFVAEKDNKVVGLIILNRHSNPRKSHVGHISIMVSSIYHGQGIGSKLMEHILDLSDCILGLKRLELFVFEENIKAIKLYQKYGFEIEGKLHCSALRNNVYSNELIMARIKDK
jgi:L-phenylalanine/L-methionine N-acetyltransferase